MTGALFPALDREAAIRELTAALAWYAERRNYAPAGGESSYDAVTARDGYDDNGPGARARSVLSIWESGGYDR